MPTPTAERAAAAAPKEAPRAGSPHDVSDGQRGPEAALRGLRSGKELRLPARAVVGRGAGCEAVLEDASVSRRHAELFRDPRGLYLLRDLGSSNGTYLGGRPVGKEPVPVEQGAKIRFGDVEVLFCHPALLPARPKLLAAASGAGILLAAIALVLWPARRSAEEAQQAAEPPSLAEGAQAALESERFDEAARLAQEAVDADPVAPVARRLLTQARREQQSQKALLEADARAQVGSLDEALQLLAQVPPASRLFPRARIKARELSEAALREHGAACRRAPRDSAEEVAEQCARALDVKCQLGPVEKDPLLRALRRAERRLGRKVGWVCPQKLSALFAQEPAGGAAVDDEALAALYLDRRVRGAVASYARGDVGLALRALTAAARRPGAAEALQRIKLVEGRFREGQTALLGGALDRADQLWNEALQADAALLPQGAASFSGRQMRSALSRAHAEAGDDRLQKLQYASAYDEYQKGLAVNPGDPHLLDQLARLRKIAAGMVGAGASCDELAIAARITRAEPQSPAHEAAQRALDRCR